MFARCMNHNKTVSSKNSAATLGRPIYQMASGVRALAMRAASEEYRVAAATASHTTQKNNAAGQWSPISRPI